MTPTIVTDCIRTLVVEDNRDICENIGDYLDALGHITDYAHDGISAMHLLALTQPFDVIVLDLTLPGMDGLTFCRKFRAEANRNTPILMLTARDTLDDKLIGLDIVRRLCEQNGWAFELRASADLVDASLSWPRQRLQPAE